MTPAEVDQVVRTHKPFIVKHARRFLVEGMSQEDLEQEAYYCLVQACQRWSPHGGANIRTYASSLVRWRLNAIRKAAYREKRRGFAISMDEPVSGLQSDDITYHDVLSAEISRPDEVLEAKERIQELHAHIARLPSRERQVLTARCEGKNLAEIGRSLGLTRERIRQLEEVAIVRLRKRMQVAA